MSLKSVFNVSSLKEALDLLNSYKEKAKIISGGTDIVIELKEGKISPEALIDISSLKDLRFIEENENYVEIGACTTFTDLWTNSIIDREFKGLAKAAHLVGSPQIRNKGTIGGNIANGSPAADTAPPLLALDSTCIIKSLNGERQVKLKDMYSGKGIVNIEPYEILYSIKINKKGKNAGVGFSKLGLRNALAISRLSVAVSLILNNGICEEFKVGSGSLSRYPEKEDILESMFVGKEINSEIIKKAADKFSDHIKERLDGRGTCEFKSEAVKGCFTNAVNEALSQVKQ